MKHDPSVLMRSAALRRVEVAAQALLPAGTLMRRAGEAAASIAVTMTRERTGRVLVLAGPGNNGGDALVCARTLHARGIDVEVAMLDDPAHLRGEAAAAWSRWQETGAVTRIAVDSLDAIDRATLVIDGLFGIGLRRPPEARARAWITAVNASSTPVLALDVPSGLDADTGQVREIAIDADRTVTFIADKPGLHTGDGADQCGIVTVDALGVDALDFDVTQPCGMTGSINRPALFADALRPRRRNSHKGSFGSVAVIGGNDGMVGAAVLCSRMAVMSGAGRVYVRLLAHDAPAFDLVHPELMFRETVDDMSPTAIALGPGLGQDERAVAELDRWIDAEASLVLDADALNLIASHAPLFRRLASRSTGGKPPAILTPHPLEAARLLSTDAKAIQADRIEAALELARRTDSIVVLKGAGTVIAEPDGAWVVNTTGNPGLATGGTGDVLCGLVAALLAQGVAPSQAARAAVWLHGTAADDCVAQGLGPIGLTASDLLPVIRDAINRNVVS